MSKWKRLLKAFIPKQEPVLPADLEWINIHCSGDDCSRKIGERSAGMSGAIRLKCRKCKTVTVIIIL